MSVYGISAQSWRPTYGPYFGVRQPKIKPIEEESTLFRRCEVASTVGKSVLGVGGILFSVGYIQNHLGYSAVGTVLAGIGATTWGLATAIEKTTEAIASLQRHLKTSRLHKPHP